MNAHGFFSHSVPDTIPGRQCMASCFFLLKQFDDVLIYLNSFKVNIDFSRGLCIQNTVYNVSEIRWPLYYYGISGIS